MKKTDSKTTKIFCINEICIASILHNVHSVSLMVGIGKNMNKENSS
jgi:hypothetical protein